MKKILLTSALFAFAVSVSAAPLSPEAALSRALNSTNTPARLKGAASPVLKITSYIDAKPSVYLFSRGEDKGFLAVSADDTTIPLLGYSDSGVLPDDFNSLPDGLRYWLTSLGQQAALNRGFYAPRDEEARAPISPLTKTLWNQDAPYYNDCPTIGTKRCYTGCVATAMAQVMKYYNYPAKGIGTHSYTWTYTSNGTQSSKTLSVDYANTSYDWENMTDTYSSSSTAVQNAAVANLMYSCGVSVDMDYGTSESGAVSFKMIPALIDNFGYDKGAQYHARDYYGLDEWESMIYDNLVNYGPVLYGGQSNDGGHQFVCDGYDGNGYFHFNWGWAGMSNGYFLLTALNPESQGIGGSTSGYNFSQDIVTHLTSSQISDNYYEEILWDGDFTISTASTTLGNTLNYSGSFYSFSSGTLQNPEIGLMLTPASGGTPIFVKYSSFQSLAPMSGLNNGNFAVTLPTNLPSGEYTVRPAFKTAISGVKAIPAPISNVGEYNMTVSGQNVTLSADEPASITASDFAFSTEVYENMPFKVTATLTDTSSTKEFYGSLAVVFVNNGSVTALGDMSAVDLQPGESSTWEYVSSLSAASSSTELATNTTYQAYLCQIVDGNAQPIAGPLSVTIYPASSPALSVNSLTIADNQSPSNMTATANIGCSSGYFAGSLTLAIFPMSGGSAIGQYSSDFFSVGGGAASIREKAPSTADVNYHFNFSNGQPDTSYFGVLYAGQTQLSNPVEFHTAVDSGVSGVSTEDITSTTYYSLTGVNVGAEAPAPGVYIVRQTHRDGHVSTARTVVK